MQAPVPDGHSLHSYPPGLFATGDWMYEKSKNEDEEILRDWLHDYREAGHPNFKPRHWLTTLEGLENVTGKTSEWCRERANLLLHHLQRSHKLTLLHRAIDYFKAIDGQPFVPPDQDKKMYFVVCLLIEGDPELAFESLSGKRPAFMIAASQGAVFIVKFALEKLKKLLDVRSATSMGDLTKNLFNMLKVPDLAANTALGLAVEEGHADIVQILLDVDERLAEPEYLRDDHIKEAVGKCQIKIMNMVLEARPSIAEKLPEWITQSGGQIHKEMWTAMAPRFKESLPGSDILHLAVKEGKIYIIDWLLREFPQMVTRKDRWGQFALSYNKDQAFKESIRSSIVPVMVRLCNPIQTKEILRHANDTPRQASLDLRVFNQDTHNFAHFVELIRANIRTRSGLGAKPDPTSNIGFESVLRYVHFPELSQVPLSKDQKRERPEVPLILEWLHQKGVKSILRLVVPDLRVNPLDEDRICRCLKSFEVEELNWRRLDLGIDPIVSLASTLAVLHLYSSGNWAVLSHWVSEAGLKRLGKLRELHIIIVEDSMTKVQAQHYEERALGQLRDLKIRLGWDWHPVVKIGRWSHGAKIIRKVKGTIDTVDPEGKSACSCINLDTFVNEYTNTQQARLDRSNSLRKIKIALIDTGVGAMGDRSQLQFKPGVSFGYGADGESESPWWIPSNEHGPQMADIICSIDPYCEIYPVKITDDSDEGAVKAPPVIEAIKWAVEQGVDIISLSLVLFNNHKGLYDAVYQASQKHIVIICSTADRGNNHQKVYPAQYWQDAKTDCVIPIAGCDQYGKLTDWSTETKAKYHFLGKDVTARSVGLMRTSSREISGSSVATAIAAGTASLVLACSNLALEEEKYSRKQRIEIFFEKMQTDENRSHNLKYVEPAIIFGENSIAQTSLESYVKQTFSKFGLLNDS